MNYLYAFILLVLVSCVNDKKTSFEAFTRENIPSSTLTPEVILIFDDLDNEDDYNINDVFIYNDSIRIKTYKSNPNSKNLIKFCNINNPSQDKGYLSFGHGNMEMIGAMFYQNDNFFFATDVQGLTLALFNIDSAFNKNYSPRIIKLNNAVVNCLALKNEDIIYCNEYFFDYCSTNQTYNKGAERVIKLEKKNQYQSENIAYKDFTPNLGAACIIANNENNRFISVSKTFPEITILDSSFNVIRVIVGPDKFDYKFELSEYAGIIQDIQRFTYASLCKTNDDVYLVYEGYNGSNHLPYNYKAQKYSLIKMDWDGNIKHIYQLQGTLYKPKIINNNELYGTTFIGEKPALIKYTL